MFAFPLFLLLLTPLRAAEPAPKTGMASVVENLTRLYPEPLPPAIAEMKTQGLRCSPAGVSLISKLTSVTENPNKEQAAEITRYYALCVFGLVEKRLDYFDENPPSAKTLAALSEGVSALRGGNFPSYATSIKDSLSNYLFDRFDPPTQDAKTLERAQVSAATLLREHSDPALRGERAAPFEKVGGRLVNVIAAPYELATGNPFEAESSLAESALNPLGTFNDVLSELVRLFQSSPTGKYSARIKACTMNLADHATRDSGVGKHAVNVVGGLLCPAHHVGLVDIEPAASDPPKYGQYRTFDLDKIFSDAFRSEKKVSCQPVPMPKNETDFSLRIRLHCLYALYGAAFRDGGDYALFSRNCATFSQDLMAMADIPEAGFPNAGFGIEAAADSWKSSDPRWVLSRECKAQYSDIQRMITDLAAGNTLTSEHRALLQKSSLDPKFLKLIRDIRFGDTSASELISKNSSPLHPEAWLLIALAAAQGANPFNDEFLTAHKRLTDDHVEYFFMHTANSCAWKRKEEFVRLVAPLSTEQKSRLAAMSFNWEWGLRCLAEEASSARK